MGPAPEGYVWKVSCNAKNASRFLIAKSHPDIKAYCDAWDPAWWTEHTYLTNPYNNRQDLFPDWDCVQSSGKYGDWRDDVRLN